MSVSSRMTWSHEDAYLIEKIAVHVLIDRIAQAIANGHAFEMYLQFCLRILIFEMNLVGNRRDVLSCVALAGDVERVRGVVGEDLKELNQAGVEITSDIVLRACVTSIVGCETEACAHGIVDEEQVIVLVPGD